MAREDEEDSCGKVGGVKQRANNSGQVYGHRLWCRLRPKRKRKSHHGNNVMLDEDVESWESSDEDVADVGVIESCESASYDIVANDVEEEKSSSVAGGGYKNPKHRTSDAGYDSSRLTKLCDRKIKKPKSKKRNDRTMELLGNISDSSNGSIAGVPYGGVAYQPADDGVRGCSSAHKISCDKPCYFDDTDTRNQAIHSSSDSGEDFNAEVHSIEFSIRKPLLSYVVRTFSCKHTRKDWQDFQTPLLKSIKDELQLMRIITPYPSTIGDQEERYFTPCVLNHIQNFSEKVVQTDILPLSVQFQCSLCPKSDKEHDNHTSLKLIDIYNNICGDQLFYEVMMSLKMLPSHLQNNFFKDQDFSNERYLEDLNYNKHNFCFELHQLRKRHTKCTTTCTNQLQGSK